MGETRLPGQFWVVFLLSAALFAAPCAGQTVTVDANGTGDYPTIQAAIDDSNDGDVIVLWPGTYTGPGNRDMDLKGKAITVRSTDPNDPNIVGATIIDCNYSGRAFYLHSWEDANSVVAGLTVTKGYGGSLGVISCLIDVSPLITKCRLSGNQGYGAIYSSHGNPGPIIIDCTIIGNSNSGVYCDSSNIVIDGCTISGNGTSGLTYCHGTITNSTISNNSGPGVNGAGISGGGGVLDNCTISGNRGAAAVDRFVGDISNCLITNNLTSGIRSCHGTITGCIISGNITKYESRVQAGKGGGIFFEPPWPSTCKVANCVISGNSAEIDGGGICCIGQSPEIINCIITGNRADYQGGGIYCDGASPIITNCTIARNVAEWGGGIFCYRNFNLVLHSSILWSNAYRQIILGGSGPVTVSRSAIEGGWSGEGNIDADPCFADPNNGDHHLKSQAGRWDATEGRWTIDEVTSLCIDAGDPMAPIMHEPFPNGGIINMGAYGGTAEASKSYFGKTPCEVIVAGDINGDCIIDFMDFQIMGLHWCEDYNP